MTDPFDELRDTEPGATPDPRAVRARARRIQARRNASLGTLAGLAVVISAVAIVVNRGDRPDLVSPISESRRGAERAGDEAGSESAALMGAIPATTAPSQAGTPPAIPGPGPAGSQTRTSGAMAASDQAALELKLVVAKETVGVGEEAVFRLESCNRGSRPVSAQFTTAKRYDFIVARGDREVWRWSSGRTFAQVIGDEQWAAGECKGWEVRWRGVDDEGRPVSPGSYRVTGVLTTQPERRAEPRRVCVLACD